MVKLNLVSIITNVWRKKLHGAFKTGKNGVSDS
jgi:hypothetical protein